jgi:DNA-binding MarR family transcriptional regulator
MENTQSAIRQTVPFRSKSQEALITLFLTVDRVRSAAARMLEPHDVTPQQYNVLRILRGAGPEGLPTLAIARRMIERAPGITRMIDRLEGKGLVERERRGADRRCVHCRIAPVGLELLGRLDGVVDEFEREALGVLSPDELHQLTEMLTRVRLASELRVGREPGGL